MHLRKNNESLYKANCTTYYWKHGRGVVWQVVRWFCRTFVTVRTAHLHHAVCQRRRHLTDHVADVITYDTATVTDNFIDNPLLKTQPNKSQSSLLLLQKLMCHVGSATRYLTDAKLSWPSWLGNIPMWYTRPKTITHPSTNWAQRRVTPFMQQTTLLLCQTTNQNDNITNVQKSLDLPLCSLEVNCMRVFC